MGLFLGLLVQGAAYSCGFFTKPAPAKKPSHEDKQEYVPASDPYQEGYDTGHEDCGDAMKATYEGCPYPEGSVERDAWEEGHDAGEDDC